MFLYDFPLSPKARTYLKFETIFTRIQECCKVQSSSETFCLIRGLIDFIDLLDGCGTLKIDLSKDLDQIRLKLNIWKDDPNANVPLVLELLEQVNEANQYLEQYTRQRTVLQNDHILENVKPRFLTPVGVNCFDTPIFVYWNNLKPEEKQESVNKWIREMDSIRIPIQCIMNIWRLTSEFQSRVAIKGFMQETSEPCEMIAIRYPEHVRGFPVVSGFQSNINVRFYPFTKGASVGDIAFELAYIRGGVK